MSIPILIDVDTGYDNALTLLLALQSPRLNVLGITCVGGNLLLDRVVDNTLRLLDAIHDIAPVAVAADRPLLRPCVRRRHFTITTAWPG